MIIAPATANIIGKFVQGIADDPLTTLFISSKAPKLIAPAMNRNMWENKIVQENITKAKEAGCRIVGPEVGWLACGVEGIGRMAEVANILKEAEEIIGRSKDLKGLHILITAGGTREAIDPVRFIANRSSGKMGYAIADEAVNRGAEVTLVTTPTNIKKPPCKTIEVESASQMERIVNLEFKRNDVVIMAAAVADYSPVHSSKGKIKKTSSKLRVDLKKTQDILAGLGKKKGNKFLIGFALETDNLIENAKKKLLAKNLDMIVANDETAFDNEKNKATFVMPSGSLERLPLISKKELAHKILDVVVRQRSGFLSVKSGLGHGRSLKPMNISANQFTL